MTPDCKADHSQGSFLFYGPFTAPEGGAFAVYSAYDRLYLAALGGGKRRLADAGKVGDERARLFLRVVLRKRHEINVFPREQRPDVPRGGRKAVVRRQRLTYRRVFSEST